MISYQPRLPFAGEIARKAAGEETIPTNAFPVVVNNFSMGDVRYV